MTSSIARLAVAGLLMLPAAAAAQTESKTWFVAPFAASTGGGDATTTSPSVGVTGGWMGRGWVGAEADFTWAPEFFEQTGFLSRRSMVTFMGNGVVKLTSGREGVQPFASAGLGLIRPSLAEAGELAIVEANLFGWNAGGGATFTKDRIGVRADVRYFRGLEESDATRTRSASTSRSSGSGGSRSA
jgi:hypothetical protein